MYFDSNNILNLMYDGPEISSNYWPDPFKQWWENNRTAYNNSRYGSLDRHGAFSASDHMQFNSSDMGEGVTRRLTLDYDGNLRLYSLDGGDGSWHVTWAALPRPCDVHGVCGRYGVCAYLPALACSCPEGFVASDAGDWSKGCRREFDLRCGEPVYFAEMPGFDYWGFDFNYTRGLTMEMCRQICLDDCNCEAFGYKMGTGECYPKISLWNGGAPNILKQNIFLKVPTRVKNLSPGVLDFHGHACTVHDRTPASSAPPPTSMSGGTRSTSSTSTRFSRWRSSWRPFSSSLGTCSSSAPTQDGGSAMKKGTRCCYASSGGSPTTSSLR